MPKTIGHDSKLSSELPLWFFLGKTLRQVEKGRKVGIMAKLLEAFLLLSSIACPPNIIPKLVTKPFCKEIGYLQFLQIYTISTRI